MSDSDTEIRTDGLVMLGGGEHATVVADAAREGTWRLLGFAGPDPTYASSLDDVPYLGHDEAFASELSATKPEDRPSLVIAFGGIEARPARRRLAERYAHASFATIVHPAAWVSRSASLGSGTVVLAGAVVNAGASIGRHVIVNTGAVVEHDVELGDFVQVSPGAIIGGGTKVAEEAFVGLGAIVRDHLAVGARAVIGMGAVVVSDVSSDTVVMGSPARPGSKAHAS